MPSTSYQRLAAIGGLMGLVAAALFILQPLATLIVRYDVNAALRSIEGTAIVTGKLAQQIGFYAFAVILVHCALGVIAAAVAFVWASAYPQLRDSGPQLTLLWVVALVAWVILANAAWFPLANSSAYYADMVRQLPFGPRLPFFAGIALGIFAAIPVLIVASRVVRRRCRWSRPIVASVAMLTATSVATSVASSAWRSPDAPSERPNVVLIGVDSLRLEFLQEFGGTGETPNLDRFLSRSATFTDAITPLSRTFPAWVSILTGQHPRTHGAVANLVPRSTVNADNSLGNLLRRHGYNSVMVTDEVRFSNIDESYGFDELITPRIGASDFLLGTLNDLPLTNLLSVTPVGKVLFPNSYANRAVAETYQPGVFLNRLSDEISSDGTPKFLAVHLAVAHFPYHSAQSAPPPSGLSEGDLQFWNYRHGLRTADQMFGEVIDILSAKGLLRNAIVVLLSDHGEALLQPGDRLVDPDGHHALGAERQIEVPFLGHGTSVLSPPQFQVLLAMRAFGGAAKSTRWPAPGRYTVPASLEDIAPTLTDGLNLGPAPNPFDGHSLLAAGKPDARAFQRIRFTETDFNVPGMLAGVINPARIAEEGAKYYAIAPDTGWLHLKPTVMPDVYDMKQRAAIQGDWMLAALPTLDAGTRYLLINRTTRNGRLLLEPPPKEDAPASELWAALHERFPGELREPSQ